MGSWITLSDPSVAEIMAQAGFDWLTVDMEHSSITLHEAQQLIRVIELCGVTPLVRVEENNHNYIKRVMDAGAHGVIVPMVNTERGAKKAVDAVKYPPLGKRGFGLTRAQRYGLGLEEYRKWNHEESIVIVQIEHFRAVENMESIMAVDGVDGFMIGPYDLSGSLGCPGDFDNPAFRETINEICRKSKSSGYLMGQHIVKPSENGALDAIDMGFRFLALGVDFLFLGESCRKLLGEVKGKLK
ncbi:MAG: 2,4-dihydroxyhept-2-ene-1,7-dioic acid aldolase [Bacteroidia bacterium]|nr:2,4-dihydroxyhept-2-ene-1,7-dioic acid aldolase [Bacteroidia bacterium]